MLFLGPLALAFPGRFPERVLVRRFELVLDRWLDLDVLPCGCFLFPSTSLVLLGRCGLRWPCEFSLERWPSR